MLFLWTLGEIMVCVLDFKREVGLWHSMLASVFNGMHVIFIPYALMKVNPASWMQMVTKHRATVAVCKSRDLHWGLLGMVSHIEKKKCLEVEIEISNLKWFLIVLSADFFCKIC